jgi:aldehyde dehydrogenase (NAD+)
MVGFNTFAECSNARAVVEEGPALGDPRAMFPPLTDKYKKQLAQLLNHEGPVLPDRVVRLIDRLIKLKGAFSRS